MLCCLAKQLAHSSLDGILGILFEEANIIHHHAHVHFGVDFVHVLATSAAAARKADLDVVCAQQHGSESASTKGRQQSNKDAAAMLEHL